MEVARPRGGAIPVEVGTVDVPTIHSTLPSPMCRTLSLGSLPKINYSYDVQVESEAGVTVGWSANFASDMTPLAGGFSALDESAGRYDATPIPLRMFTD